MPVNLLPDSRGLCRVKIEVLASYELRGRVDLVVGEGDMVWRDLGDLESGDTVLDIGLLVVRAGFAGTHLHSVVV